nr:hypothetical protein [Tanacetum cinerariifolium]
RLFSKTPSLLYQNYLREFWCTTEVVDPNPPINDSKAHPYKELSIKFNVNNVLSGNHSSTEHVNSGQQMIIYSLPTGTKIDIGEISYNDLEVQNVVKEDPTLNKKVLEAAEVYTKNSTNLTELFTMVKNFDFPSLKTTVESLHAAATAQNDHLAKWAESSVSMSFSTSSRSVPEPTLEIIKVYLNVKGRIQHTMQLSVLLPAVTPPETEIIRSSSRPQLIDPIVEVQVSQPIDDPPYTTPMDNRENGIAKDTGKSPRKLVPASKEVRLDPDTPVLIPYEINGKMYQLTNEQIQAHLEKEEQIERAAQEAKMIELNKPALIKVVEEVSSEAEVDPNVLRNKKGGQEFLKQ